MMESQGEILCLALHRRSEQMSIRSFFGLQSYDYEKKKGGRKSVLLFLVFHVGNWGTETKWNNHRSHKESVKSWNLKLGILLPNVVQRIALTPRPRFLPCFFYKCSLKTSAEWTSDNAPDPATLRRCGGPQGWGVQRGLKQRGTQLSCTPNSFRPPGQAQGVKMRFLWGYLSRSKDTSTGYRLLT